MGVLPALEQGDSSPGAGAHLAGFVTELAIPSLQRFTRYPGSRVSIRPLAPPHLLNRTRVMVVGQYNARAVHRYVEPITV